MKDDDQVFMNLGAGIQGHRRSQVAGNSAVSKNAPTTRIRYLKATTSLTRRALLSSNTPTLQLSHTIYTSTLSDCLLSKY